MLWQQLHYQVSNSNSSEASAVTLLMQVDGNLMFQGPEPTKSVLWSRGTSH
jgi:hypothetical protein